jgi:hypothetical protein
MTGKLAASSVDSLCLSQVRVDFEPWDNFCFFECENGHYSEEKAKIVAPNKHISMTMSDNAPVVSVGKSSVSKSSLCIHGFWIISPKRKGKMWKKTKNHSSYRTDQLLLRNNRLHPTMTRTFKEIY